MTARKRLYGHPSAFFDREANGRRPEQALLICRIRSCIAKLVDGEIFKHVDCFMLPSRMFPKLWIAMVWVQCILTRKRDDNLERICETEHVVDPSSFHRSFA